MYGPSVSCIIHTALFTTLLKDFLSLSGPVAIYTVHNVTHVCCARGLGSECMYNISLVYSTSDSLLTCVHYPIGIPRDSEIANVSSRPCEVDPLANEPSTQIVAGLVTAV